MRDESTAKVARNPASQTPGFGQLVYLSFFRKKGVEINPTKNAIRNRMVDFRSSGFRVTRTQY
jgi:hypothetical protein